MTSYEWKSSSKSPHYECIKYYLKTESHLLGPNTRKPATKKVSAKYCYHSKPKDTTIGDTVCLATKDGGHPVTGSCTRDQFKHACVGDKILDPICQTEWLSRHYGDGADGSDYAVAGAIDPTALAVKNSLNDMDTAKRIDIIQNNNYVRFTIKDHSGMFDDIMSEYCSVNPGDDLCKCIKSPLSGKISDSSIALMTPCGASGGYFTQKMKDAHKVSVLDCKQILKVNKSGTAVVDLDAVQQCKSMIGDDGATTDIQGGGIVADDPKSDPGTTTKTSTTKITNKKMSGLQLLLLVIILYIIIHMVTKKNKYRRVMTTRPPIRGYRY
jgi:hypothetical protein|uniref:Uncharacterized protein n=1 Tax=viral metagenome TaxID=1070528 RepID=A0A6C0IUJ1_9ZZZZ